jgi:hypothetical protein
MIRNGECLDNHHHIKEGFGKACFCNDRDMCNMAVAQLISPSLIGLSILAVLIAKFN